MVFISKEAHSSSKPEGGTRNTVLRKVRSEGVTSSSQMQSHLALPYNWVHLQSLWESDPNYTYKATHSTGKPQLTGKAHSRPAQLLSSCVNTAFQHWKHQFKNTHLDSCWEFYQGCKTGLHWKATGARKCSFPAGQLTIHAMPACWWVASQPAGLVLELSNLAGSQISSSETKTEGSFSEWHFSVHNSPLTSSQAALHQFSFPTVIKPVSLKSGGKKLK